MQDKGRMSETYVKSWFSGALGRAAAQRSATFMLVVHHPSHIFLFFTIPQVKVYPFLISLPSFSRKQQHEAWLLLEI